MAFYKLSAEHVHGKDAMYNKIKEKYDVLIAGKDPVFCDEYIVVIEGTEKDADKVRDIMWKYNNGASCTIKELTEDQFDAMC